jgi:hypothetical protein
VELKAIILRDNANVFYRISHIANQAFNLAVIQKLHAAIADTFQTGLKISFFKNQQLLN